MQGPVTLPRAPRRTRNILHVDSVNRNCLGNSLWRSLGERSGEGTASLDPDLIPGLVDADQDQDIRGAVNLNERRKGICVCVLKQDRYLFKVTGYLVLRVRDGESVGRGEQHPGPALGAGPANAEWRPAQVAPLSTVTSIGRLIAVVPPVSVATLCNV